MKKINTREARESPRFEYGQARRSAFNTSFPEEDENGENWIRFIRFGRVKLDLFERIPRVDFEDLFSECENHANKYNITSLSKDILEGLIRDFEACFYHLVADELSEEDDDIGLPVYDALKSLSELIHKCNALTMEDWRVFSKYVSNSSPPLVRVLKDLDGLDEILIGASIVPAKHAGRPRLGNSSLVEFTSALLDDWKRQAHRPVTLAEHIEAPLGFFPRVLSLMKRNPPTEQLDLIRSNAPALLKNISGNLFEKSLRSAVRSGA